ncbi:hypothetical protein KXD40_008864 [Peronospora effusa]|nr:hypothetical protein KXD40_008864 [Peronospora effusa]
MIERAKKMFDVLAKLYKGDDLTKVLVVGAERGVGPSKNLARNLLDFQLAEWVHDDNISDRKVFDLLLLHETKDNPLESPIFFKWLISSRNDTVSTKRNLR